MLESRSWIHGFARTPRLVISFFFFFGLDFFSFQSIGKKVARLMSFVKLFNCFQFCLVKDCDCCVLYLSSLSVPGSSVRISWSPSPVRRLAAAFVD